MSDLDARHWPWDADTPLGDGPWEVRWQWSTGLRGIDRFQGPERAVVFCTEMLEREKPPRYTVARLSARNTLTSERLGDVVGGKFEPPLPTLPPVAGMAPCATCGGAGKIRIVQTGRIIGCTRCEECGYEPRGRHS